MDKQFTFKKVYESDAVQRISYGITFHLFGAITEKADSEYANDVECYTNFMTWHFRLYLLEL